MPKGDVGRNVIAAMQRAGLKASDLVRAAKDSETPISYARITNWKNGENDPHTDLLPFLSRVVGATISELLGETPLNPNSNGPRRASAVGDLEVPRLSPVRAGAEWTDPFDCDQTEPIPSFMVDELTFCCPVEGDSMMDFLQPGDMAVFRREAMPNIGNIVAARNGKSELTIKQLKHDGEQYVLTPLNPKYDLMEAHEWWIEGTLTGYIRYRGEERQIRHHPRGLRP